MNLLLAIICVFLQVCFVYILQFGIEHGATFWCTKHICRNRYGSIPRARRTNTEACEIATNRITHSIVQIYIYKYIFVYYVYSVYMYSFTYTWLNIHSEHDISFSIFIIHKQEYFPSLWILSTLKITLYVYICLNILLFT